MHWIVAIDYAMAGLAVAVAALVGCVLACIGVVALEARLAPHRW